VLSIGLMSEGLRCVGGGGGGGSWGGGDVDTCGGLCGGGGYWCSVLIFSLMSSLLYLT